MSKEFGYPKKTAMGETVLTDTHGEYRDMLMDISVLQMKAGEIKKITEPHKETAALLLTGEVTLAWDGQSRRVQRRELFKDAPYCLHVCKNVEITLTAHTDCEILLQQTENDKEFAPVFYEKGSYRDEVFGRGLCDDVAVRRVVTFFDYDNAPYSNMVLGEITSNQGGWSSYIPHSHRQPEVYYYRFDHPNGFGGCFIGEDVFKVTDRSFCAIPGGKTHPQVSAPGYRMYYAWMIRHLPGDPWTDRVMDEKHTWLAGKKDFEKI